MASHDRYGRIAEAEWFGIPDLLLWGTSAQQEVASTLLWLELIAFVDRIRLPQLGHFQNDAAARLCVAKGVMELLAAYDWHHVREWRDRQRAGGRSSPWWEFIHLVAKQIAADFVHGHREYATRREEPTVGLPDRSSRPLQHAPIADFAYRTSKVVAYLERCDAKEIDHLIAELEYLSGAKNRTGVAGSDDTEVATPATSGNEDADRAAKPGKPE